MKLLLLFVFTFVFSFSEAQTPIQNYNSNPLSNYYVVSTPSAIDQSPTGANAIWTFSSFSTTGTTTEDTYAVPTSGELIEYPNTTSVQTTTSTPLVGGTNKVFTENIAGLVSLTGIEREGLSLNYDGDNTRNIGEPVNPIPPNDDNGNAVIGIFPLAFGSTNSDDVSGSFDFFSPEFGNLSGTFEGLITTTVDAYGTLNTNDLGNGSGSYSGQVTRLKIEQNIIFNVLNASASQLSYYYYDDITGNIFLRYTELVISTTGTLFDPIEEVLIERLDTNSLDINKNNLNALSVFPNPVKNHLNINLKQKARIKSIKVYDISGRQVMKTKTNTTLVDVSALKSGLYIINVATEKGALSHRFTKD
ncbi:MAG: T9SS type A sorting domain-containing protein [Algibacter sp.]|nr:T9SS type A sorting domain-containing protein [Algibacter sp.]MDG1728384.1 T9SS type A sorting domain-containing protein [Algibacter sp.]